MIRTLCVCTYISFMFIKHKNTLVNQAVRTTYYYIIHIILYVFVSYVIHYCYVVIVIVIPAHRP